ncbi:MAG: hypothetical protein QW286_02355 [Candidatus Aenigmatarchaeota archaeon]
MSESKGAIELSLGLIVAIVFSVVLLSFGILFASNMLGGTKTVSEEMNQMVQNKIDETFKKSKTEMLKLQDNFNEEINNAKQRYQDLMNQINQQYTQEVENLYELLNNEQISLEEFNSNYSYIQIKYETMLDDIKNQLQDEIEKIVEKYIDDSGKILQKYGYNYTRETKPTISVITGYVKAQDGSPIEGAQVSAGFGCPFGPPPSPPTATTNSNGFYSLTFDWGDCKQATLSVYKKDCTFDSAYLTLNPGGDPIEKNFTGNCGNIEPPSNINIKTLTPKAFPVRYGAACGIPYGESINPGETKYYKIDMTKWIEWQREYYNYYEHIIARELERCIEEGKKSLEQYNRRCKDGQLCKEHSCWPECDPAKPLESCSAYSSII